MEIGQLILELLIAFIKFIFSDWSNYDSDILITQGSTAYFNNAITIDGVSVTPLWQGSYAPTFGNSSGVDSYTYAICKTADSTYSVFASLTQF